MHQRLQPSRYAGAARRGGGGRARAHATCGRDGTGAVRVGHACPRTRGRPPRLTSGGAVPPRPPAPQAAAPTAAAGALDRAEAVAADGAVVHAAAANRRGTRVGAALRADPHTSDTREYSYQAALTSAADCQGPVAATERESRQGQRPPLPLHLYGLVRSCQVSVSSVLVRYTFCLRVFTRKPTMLAWRIENASRQLSSHSSQPDALSTSGRLGIRSPPASSTNCSCASWHSICLATNWNPVRLVATVLEPRSHILSRGVIQRGVIISVASELATLRRSAAKNDIKPLGLDVPAQRAERGRSSPELPSSSRLPPVHGG